MNTRTFLNCFKEPVVRKIGFVDWISRSNEINQFREGTLCHEGIHLKRMFSKKRKAYGHPRIVSFINILKFSSFMSHSSARKIENNHTLKQYPLYMCHNCVWLLLGVRTSVETSYASEGLEEVLRLGSVHLFDYQIPAGLGVAFMSSFRVIN